MSIRFDEIPDDAPQSSSVRLTDIPDDQPQKKSIRFTDISNDEDQEHLRIPSESILTGEMPSQGAPVPMLKSFLRDRSSVKDVPTALAAGVTGSIGRLAGSMDKVARYADDLANSVGIHNERKPQFFAAVRDLMSKDTDYWQSVLDKDNADVAIQKIGKAIGGTPAGIAEFAMGVPMAAIEGAAEAHEKGTSELYGATAGGAKRYVLGKVLGKIGDIDNPVARRATAGVVGAGQTLLEGGSLQDAGTNFLVMGAMASKNPQDAQDIIERYRPPPSPDASLKSPTAPEALPFIRQTGEKQEVQPANERINALQSFRLKSNDPDYVEGELKKAGFSDTEAARYSTDFVPEAQAQAPEVQTPALDPAKSRTPGTLEYDVDQYMKRNGGTPQDAARALTLARSNGTQPVAGDQGVSDAGVSTGERGSEAQKKLSDLNLPAQAEPTVFVFKDRNPQSIHNVGVYTPGAEIAHDTDTRTAIQFSRETGMPIDQAALFLKSLRGPEETKTSPLSDPEADAVAHFGVENPHEDVERSRRILNSASALSKGELDSIRKITGDSPALAKTLEWGWNQGSAPADPGLREAYISNLKEASQRIGKLGKPGMMNRQGALAGKIGFVRSADGLLERYELAAGVPLRPAYHDMLQYVTEANQQAVDKVKNALAKAGLTKRDRPTPSDWKTIKDALFTGDMKLVATLSNAGKRAYTVLKSVGDEYAPRVRAYEFDQWTKTGEVPGGVPKAQANDILEAGQAALRNGTFTDWIKGQTWGTRDAYFPAKRQDTGADDLGPILDPGSLVRGERTPAGPKNNLTAAHKRGSKAEPADGHPIDVMIRHMAQVDTALALKDKMPRFWEDFQKAHPGQEDNEYMREYLKGMLGKGSRSWIDSKVNAIFPHFWNTFFLDPFKSTFFALRDVLRIPALFPLGFRASETARALARMTMDRAAGKTNEQASRHFQEDWEPRIRQDAEYMRQVGQADFPAPELTGGSEAMNQYRQAAQVAGELAMGGDRMTRIWAWGLAHNMAQHVTEAFQLGKINGHQVRDRLLLDSMALSQRSELLSLLTKGDYDTFMRRYAEYKSDNINGSYQQALRSPIEQRPSTRALLAPIVWTRTMWKVAGTNCVGAIYRGLQSGNNRQFTQGVRNTVAMVIGMQAADYAAEKITGRKGVYSLVSNLLPGFLAPGLSIVRDMADGLRQAHDQYLQGRIAGTKAVERSVASVMDPLGRQMPFVGTEMIRLYADSADAKDKPFWTTVESVWDKEYGKEHKGKPMRRSDYEAVAHFLFGGFNEEPKKGQGK